MTRPDRDATTLRVDRMRQFPVDEATKAAARRTVARILVGNDPRATNDELRDRIAEALEMLGLLPGLPDRPARRRT